MISFVHSAILNFNRGNLKNVRYVQKRFFSHFKIFLCNPKIRRHEIIEPKSTEIGLQIEVNLLEPDV